MNTPEQHLEQLKKQAISAVHNALADILAMAKNGKESVEILQAVAASTERVIASMQRAKPAA